MRGDAFFKNAQLLLSARSGHLELRQELRQPYQDIPATP